ncbi:hypothetical protein MA04_00135 [Alcanivorax balearicus MACL04]|uniref:Kazal-like domain-containing protein n=1 Tax=Alloalcanivorax balearicus MACL04 TaxID=1177182 RepID=A0ABT2QTM1_9GAMM|nr:hypothetical protein [Alloalcanivorax balearicus]MCU5780835.1 hypothetical protein [Alloalcanivorax balearicus MACL04]
MHRILFVTAAAALFATGCASTPSANLPEGATACPDKRPTVCTMDYNPVNGFNAAGEDQGEFGNACGACGQDDISYTIPVRR